MNNREEFEKWFDKQLSECASERYITSTYKNYKSDKTALFEGFSAACELKDKELNALKADRRVLQERTLAGRTEMNNREDFEKWWAETMNINEFDLHFVEGRYYLCHETERSWMAWQACAEAKDKELDAFKAENIALRKVWGERCEELAALNSRPAPAIPDGYVLVPAEPTDEMIDLACDITDTYRVEMVRAYEAMIAAAQKEIK
jgi:hypothetical protein